MNYYYEPLDNIKNSKIESMIIDKAPTIQPINLNIQDTTSTQVVFSLLRLIEDP